MPMQLRVVFYASLLVAVLWPVDGEVPREGDRPPPEAEASEAIHAILDACGAPVDEAGEWEEIRQGLLAAYAPSATPLWLRAGRPTSQALAAVRLLQAARSHGLSAEDYDGKWLAQRLDETREVGPANEMTLALFDAALSMEMLRYLRAIHKGRVRPGDVGFEYHLEMEGAELGKRLRREVSDGGDLARLATELEPRLPQYPRLKRALERERQLLVDGDAGAPARIRQIELALERLRWLPHAPAGPLVIVNIPAFRLVAFASPDDQRPTLQMAIVVGRAARTQTPVFAAELTQVLFRPSWYPPPSILRNEILPRVERDPSYLQREHMDVVGGPAEAIVPLSPGALIGLRSGRLRLRQNPGPHNALGLVKFVFPNEHRVYMHDTPARSLFSRVRRDFSHGCVRVEQPARLAAFVLARQPGWTLDRIEAAMKGARTVSVDVGPAVPVYLYYSTVVVRADDSVEFFDDIYGLDARLHRALASGGHQRAASRVPPKEPSLPFVRSR